MLLAQDFDLGLYLFTQGGGEPQTANHQVLRLGFLRGEEVGMSLVTVDFKFHGAPPR